MKFRSLLLLFTGLLLGLTARAGSTVFWIAPDGRDGHARAALCDAHTRV